MSKKHDFVEKTMQNLAGEAELSASLSEIFARILSRQVTIDEDANQVDFNKAALARPKGARLVVQTTGFQPHSLSVGGSVRRSSTHQLSAGGC